MLRGVVAGLALVGFTCWIESRRRQRLRALTRQREAVSRWENEGGQTSAVPVDEPLHQPAPSGGAAPG